jgi:hypothetical protein
LKPYLRPATAELVQTFARSLTPADDADAKGFGYESAAQGYEDLRARSLEAWAMCLGVGPKTRVAAMAGVMDKAGSMWLHTAGDFKTGGIGVLRLAKKLIDELLGRYGTLWINVDVQKSPLVRMADWLEFRAVGTVHVGGRAHHLCRLGPLKRKEAA